MVKLFKKSRWDKPFSEKVARRVKRIPTQDLSTWADQTCYEFSRILRIYEKYQTPEASAELLVAAEALHAVSDEINRRMTSVI